MTDLRAAIIAQAKAYPGLKYRLDPPPDGVTSVDCSLFVQAVVQAAGAGDLPRTAEQQRQATVLIGWDDVLPGDLLFFEKTYDITEASAVGDGHVASHVGISLGAGSRAMWDAHERTSASAAPGITNIGGDYWQSHLLEARRLPALVDAAPMSDGMPRGIDVSSHQGAVDWRAVAGAGYSFGWTKATGGAWYMNPTLAAT